MKSKILLTLCIALIIISIPIISEAKMRIAILDLKADGVPERTARAISNMIRNEFINIGGFTVVERNQMNAIIKEQGFQQTGCTDQECAVQLGRLMSARKMLVGEVTPLGKSLIITVRIVDVEKGVSDFAAKSKAPTEEQLDVATAELTKKLSRRIKSGKKYEEETEEKVEEPEKEEPSVPGVITPMGYYTRGLVPGWGQYYAGQRIKGYAFMGGFALTAVLSLVTIRNYNSAKSDYEGLSVGLNQSEYDDKYDKYERAGKVATISVGLMALVYIGNWADLFFFTSPSYGSTVSSVGPAERGRVYYSFNTFNFNDIRLSETRTSFSVNIKL